MSVFYLAAALLSFIERFSFLKQAAAFILIAECLTLGTFGGVRRALVFELDSEAQGAVRSAAVCAWFVLASLTIALGVTAVWYFRDSRFFFVSAASAILMLVRMIFDMRGEMGRLGRITRKAVHDLFLSGRAYGLALLAGALPIAACSILDERIFMISYASIAYLLYAARGGRLDDRESEKRMAIHAICLALPLMFCPSIALLFGLPRYALLIPSWAVFLSFALTLNEKPLRYGLMFSAFMSLCALTPFLPVPFASVLSAALACALLHFMRPCLYSLWLGIRARRVRRKFENM